MAGIQLIAEIEPKNSGSFALLDDKYMRGGLRVVETYDELEFIPSDRLKDGCLVMVTTPSRVLYVYDQATDTWSPFSSGGGGGGSDWLCVEDGETTKLVKDVDTWTQKVVVINHIRTYADYFALPTEYIQNNEVAYCKADVMEGTTTYKKGLYSYDIERATWVEVNSTIETDSALSDTSKRPVQNRVVTRALEEKVSKDDVDNVISRFSENPIQNKAVATALENIKNSRTMTTEEYEALDDETKNDGSFYYISDTGEIYQNGIIYGGKQIFDVTQEEYDALTDEEKANNEYHCTDTGRVYINGILYGDKKSIEMTYEEYKQLEADGLVEADVDYIIVGNESGVLLSDLDTNHGDSEISTYEVIEELKSDVENLIDDSNLTSTTSTLSANKIKNAVTYSFDTQSGNVKYVKFKPSITTISVVDIYGGKIEILGASKASANPDYKTVKVVRLSYGDWGSYDATQVPSVVHTKIGELYYYPTDEYYYLKLYNYAAFTMRGLATAPEIVTSLPAEESAMTLIPETDWGKIDDTTSSTESTWSSSMIASQINNATAIKYDNVINPNATKETGWSLAQGESHFYGRLLQLDGHLGSKSSTFSFLLFVKANYDNPTTVYVTQLAGMDDDRSNIAHTTYFELGVSSSGNLTIKNKSAVTASYRFI